VLSLIQICKVLSRKILTGHKLEENSICSSKRNLSAQLFVRQSQKKLKSEPKMRPPINDITNTRNNNNNNSSSNNNSGNGNNNGDDDSNTQLIISRLQQNGATPVAHQAGKGIIRVVSRCDDAKENNNLGEKASD